MRIRGNRSKKDGNEPKEGRTTPNFSLQQVPPSSYKWSRILVNLVNFIQINISDGAQFFNIEWIFCQYL